MQHRESPRDWRSLWGAAALGTAAGVVAALAVGFASPDLYTDWGSLAGSLIVIPLFAVAAGAVVVVPLAMLRRIGWIALPIAMAGRAHQRNARLQTHASHRICPMERRQALECGRASGGGGP